MTEFERKQLDILKTINRNLNYVGRKLELINATLERNGIAVMPGVVATEEEPEKNYGEGLSTIAELKKNLADEIVKKCF